MAVGRTRREVIAERRLEVSGTSHEPVTVSIGRPRRAKGDWQCPFWIEGAGLVIRDSGYGVDAMQALISALEGIHVRLKETGKPLSWMELADVTGFPRMIPQVDADLASRIEAVVDRELRRYAQRMRRRHMRRRR